MNTTSQVSGTINKTHSLDDIRFNADEMLALIGASFVASRFRDGQPSTAEVNRLFLATRDAIGSDSSTADATASAHEIIGALSALCIAMGRALRQR